MKNILLASLLAIASCIAYGDIDIKAPWVRATVPQQHSTGAFMEITSPSDVKLIAAESAAAQIVEIHEMKMTNNVMTMRQIPGIDIYLLVHRSSSNQVAIT